MVELTNERIDQILHQETPKKEELSTILRSIYVRYMRMYEKYFDDIDALNDEKVAEMRNYNEETISLLKHYYMDIPHDIFMEIEEFEKQYTSNFLGTEWHKFLDDFYEKFKKENKDEYRGEERLKAEFKKHTLDDFYELMGDIFREGFGTVSKTTEDAVNGISELLFGND